MPASPPTRTPSRWNGLSTEERQRERRQLLIDAAYELLSTEGSAGTTVRAVCATARLNPRYFYESFEELDALLVAVYDDVVAQLAARVAEQVRAGDDSTRNAVRASVEATVRFIDEDRRRGLVLYVEALGNETLNLRRRSTGFELVELVRRDTARRRGSKGSEQVDRLSAAMLVGGFSEMLAAWIDGRIAMKADPLIEAATALFVSVGDAAEAIVAGG